MFCKKCGNQLGASAKFCGKCGEPVASAPAPAAAAPIATVAPAVPLSHPCPACGADCRPEAKFCPKCGHFFDGVGSPTEHDATVVEVASVTARNPVPGSSVPAPREAATMPLRAPGELPVPPLDSATVACPKCHAACRPEAKFCPRCAHFFETGGAASSSVAAESEDATVIDTGPVRSAVGGQSISGEPAMSAAVVPVDPPSAPEPASSPAPHHQPESSAGPFSEQGTPAPLNNASGQACPKCGTACRLDAKFCPKCGSFFETDVAPVDEDATVLVPASAYAKLGAGAAFKPPEAVSTALEPQPLQADDRTVVPAVASPAPVESISSPAPRFTLETVAVEAAPEPVKAVAEAPQPQVLPASRAVVPDQAPGPLPGSEVDSPVVSNPVAGASGKWQKLALMAGLPLLLIAGIGGWWLYGRDGATAPQPSVQASAPLVAPAATTAVPVAPAEPVAAPAEAALPTAPEAAPLQSEPAVAPVAPPVQPAPAPQAQSAVPPAPAAVKGPRILSAQEENDLIAKLASGRLPASCGKGQAAIRKRYNLTEAQAASIAHNAYPEVCGPAPLMQAPVAVERPLPPPDPRPRKSIDETYNERASRECERGFAGLFCREKLKATLCEGQWSENPPPGKSLCRRVTPVGEKPLF